MNHDHHVDALLTPPRQSILCLEIAKFIEYLIRSHTLRTYIKTTLSGQNINNSKYTATRSISNDETMTEEVNFRCERGVCENLKRQGENVN